MARKPKPFQAGDARVRAIRGPREKDGRYYWRAELHGKTRATVWTGWGTPKEAREAARKAVNEWRDPKSDAVAFPTVSKLLGGWVWHIENERPDLADHSMREYRAAALRLKSVAADILPERLTEHVLEDVKARALRKWSPLTVKLDLQRLKMACNWAHARGAMERVPRFPHVRLPKKVKHTPTPHDVAAVMAHLTVPWHKVAVLFMWSTGCRIGELSALTRDRVHLDRAMVVLEGKTGQREFPMSPELVEALRAHLATHKLPRVLGQSNARSITESIRRAAEKAGVPRFTSHGLRRAAVDRLLTAGVDIGTAAALMGHSPKTMLKHYRQASEMDKRRAAAKLGALPTLDNVIKLTGES